MLTKYMMKQKSLHKKTAINCQEPKTCLLRMKDAAIMSFKFFEFNLVDWIQNPFLTSNKKSDVSLISFLRVFLTRGICFLLRN